jgi:cyanate permease
MPDRYRWVMLALLWLLYMSFGAIVRSLSPLVTPILADLKMSYSQMGLVMGSWQLTYIGAAFAAGFLIDKWGIRKALFWGAVVIALSSGLRYFSQGFGTFLPVVALFGLGGPMISTGCPKTISMWFRGRERGTAVGIYTTGPWIGGIIVLAATNRWTMPLTGHSWRLTFAFYGALVLAVAIIWWFLAKDLETAESSASIAMKSVFLRLIRVRNVQIALVLGLLTFAVIHSFIGWLPKILENNGFSPSMAGYLSSIPLLAGVPAVLIFPRIIPFHRRHAAITITALVMLASIWMFFSLTGALAFAGLFLYGIGSCTLVPVITLILMDTPEVGPAYMGSASGLFFCISEIGGFMAPLAIGILVDWTGGFTAAGYFMAALCLAVFGLSFFVRD